MRIITVNLNGIRSAYSKGFFEWLNIQGADVICLQEIRIMQDQLTEIMQNPGKFNSAFEFAEKRGYSGVGMYFQKNPDRIQKGIGWADLDREGRFIQADFGNLSVISLYLPSGTSGVERQNFKYKVMDYFEKWLHTAQNSGKEFVICGDWNIAHNEIDLKNWKSNQKNSGFLPSEREWMTKIFGEIGFVDVFRRLNKNVEQYTWWSNRGKSWEKNVGWRIDYQIATPEVASKAKGVYIFKEQRFSDHAPLIIDYDYKL